MTRVYLANSRPQERAALRLMLRELNMEVVGEAATWAAALLEAPTTRTDMMVVDGDLLPASSAPALDELRAASRAELVIVLMSNRDAPQQAAVSAGADAFISKDETADRLAERLRSVAAHLPMK